MANPVSEDQRLLDACDDLVTEKEKLPGKPNPLAERSKFRRWVTVEPALCVYFMAFIPSLPLMEQYVLQQVSLRNNYNDSTESTSNCYVNNTQDYVLQQAVISEAAHWMILFTAVGFMPGFITTVLLGSYSDKAGRKVVMISSLTGGILRAILMVVIISLRLPLEMLFLPVIIEGASGGISSFLMASFAYIADISTHEGRSVRIYILEVAIGVGVVVSTVTVGIMIKTIGFMYPFIVIGGLHLINLLYVVTYVIETRTKDPEAQLFTFDHYIKSFRLICCHDGSSQRWKMIVCLLILVLTCIADLGGGGVLTYFQLNTPICFDSVLVGYYQAVNYVCRNIGGVLCLKLLHSRLGDGGLMILGCISGMLYYLLIAFTTTKIMMFLDPLGAVCYMLLVPMVRSMSSKLVKADEQGTLFSSISLIQTCGIVFGSTIFNSIYSATLFIFKGTVFLVEAGFIFAAFVLTIILAVGIGREKKTNVVVERNV